MWFIHLFGRFFRITPTVVIWKQWEGKRQVLVLQKTTGKHDLVKGGWRDELHLKTESLAEAVRREAVEEAGIETFASLEFVGLWVHPYHKRSRQRHRSKLYRKPMGKLLVVFQAEVSSDTEWCDTTDENVFGGFFTEDPIDYFKPGKAKWQILKHLGW